MRETRRKDKKIETEEAMQLLAGGEYGVLSTVDRDGQPYGVPLNYVYKDNCIYFHCARIGHKIDNIESNSNVSFCVVGDAKVLPEKFTTEYVSAVAFGTASEAQGAERYNALEWLVEKYAPAFVEEGKKYIEKNDKATKVIKIEIRRISGKTSPPKA